MLAHGTQVRQRSIGEQTSGSLVDKLTVWAYTVNTETKEQAMNERIQELMEQATVQVDPDDREWVFFKVDQAKFAELIVYDFLSELTNDDSLGEARIATIKRLAEKWGVAK